MKSDKSTTMRVFQLLIELIRKIKPLNQKKPYTTICCIGQQVKRNKEIVSLFVIDYTRKLRISYIWDTKCQQSKLLL